MPSNSNFTLNVNLHAAATTFVYINRQDAVHRYAHHSVEKRIEQLCERN